MQILEAQQFGDLGTLAGIGDPRPQCVGALGTAVQAGGEDVVAHGAQAGGDRLPDPAALISAVNEHDGGHGMSLDFGQRCRNRDETPNPR